MRPTPRARRALALLLAAGCAAPRVAAPAPHPAAPPPAAAAPAPPALPVVADSAARPIAPPAVALRRGWMPLDATGVPDFRRLHPTYDGRGVLIAILDSGIDPTVDGLRTTSTGEPKVIELRDFSGEGAVPLTRVVPRGDTIVIEGQRLIGMRHIAGLSIRPAVFVGAVHEPALGAAPAADLNGSGSAIDTLPVVLVRASDGWALLTDTDGDGSLGNEHLIHDYLRSRETVGWHSRGRPSPLGGAVNIGGTDDAPTLDLLLDTGAHGTHVSGIAAAHDLYNIAGFDGVAPGAQLVGLKIADNAHGGISTTASMRRAVDYAIRFAESRRRPLVMNMSFGVGNEREGAARIDAIIDSTLALHPEVVFTISAGNDGPGLSTVGFPGSSTRALSVGATFPGLFLAATPSGRPAPEMIASFSSRGGELAKPDIVAPGIAYSSVPRWDTGNEVKNGTSMASPYAAGLAALLMSALRQEGATIDGRRIKQALMVTAQPLAGVTYVDEGTGEPSIGRAHRWLQDRRVVREVRVQADRGATAVLLTGGASSEEPRVRYTLTAAPGSEGRYRLASDSRWVSPPTSVGLAGAPVSVELVLGAHELRLPGAHVGVVTGWPADTLAGPAFRLVVTAVVPAAVREDADLVSGPLAPSALWRTFFTADSGRAVAVRVSVPSGPPALAFLHEPAGMPYREQPTRSAGAGTDAAVYQVDGRDAESGVYEVDVQAPPVGAASVNVMIRQSPLRLALTRDSSGIVATATNLTSASVATTLSAILTGGERRETIIERGSAVRRTPFVAPAWARTVVVDLRMDPAQWGRFTDLGVTLVDGTGRQLGAAPLNYAVGRLQVDLPKGHPSQAVTLELRPGFADSAAGSWAAALSIRLYADSAIALAPSVAASAAVTAAPGASVAVSFPMPASPWPLGDGFFPLGVVVGTIGSNSWTRDVGLPPLRPPVMR